MGKTGTAERGSPEFQDTSWFAAMVGPQDHPEYVVVTMVEQGGFGGQVAAPITRDVIERLEGLTSVDSPHLGCATTQQEEED
jgi:penicillin-binding protein 2